MPPTLKNQSAINLSLPNGKAFRLAIVCAEFNKNITAALYNGALSILIKAGVQSQNINTRYVPGAFEIPLAAQQFAQNTEIDGIICLGCVIKGETPHFDFICNATAQAIINTGLKYNKPIIFGILTTNTLAQAQDRAGGKYGNKGEEAALSLLNMLNYLTD